MSYPPVRAVAPWRVAEVEPLDGWRLRVRHNDGIGGQVDLSRLVNSPAAGMFAPLRDPALFARAYLDLGAVTWPGDIDLSPYEMHEQIAARGEWVLA